MTPCNEKYVVDYKYEKFRAFPEKVDRKTKEVIGRVVVVVERVLITIRLAATNEELVTFKKYNHRGQWGWTDSRDKRKKPYEQDVVRELARMLYGGDEETAKALVRRACTV